MENIDIAALAQNLLGTLTSWAPKIIGGLAILIIGFWIAKVVTNIVSKGLTKSGIDADLKPFLTSII